MMQSQEYQNISGNHIAQNLTDESPRGQRPPLVGEEVRKKVGM